MARFADRRDAGRRLGALVAERLAVDGDGDLDVVVLGLPRGGVVVAAEVADALGAPLDAFGVRKLGVPGHKELAMGAIASGGIRVLNERVLASARIDMRRVEQVAAAELAELERREALYRDGREPVALTGRTVVLVDDGLATGSTMRAAVAAVSTRAPAALIVAVPVGAASTCRSIAEDYDEVVDVLCLESPKDFNAVGEWYRDFSQTTDEEVRALLSGTR